MSEQNIFLIRHLFDNFFCKANELACQELIAPGICVNVPASWNELHEVTVSGKESIKRIDEEYNRAFEIFAVKVKDIFAQNDRVAVRWECEGIHKAPFFYLPASYRNFSLSGQSIYRINHEGLISEIWHAWDMHAFIKDLSFQSPELLKKISCLTLREHECIAFLLEGKTARETAKAMKLSPRTIEYYLENIKDKFNCLSKRELFAFCRVLEKQHLI